MNQSATFAPAANDLNNQHNLNGENSTALDTAPQANTGIESAIIVADAAPMPTEQAPLKQEVAAAATKKSHRHELTSLLADLRSDIEAKASAAINAKHRHQYKGTFEVRFDMPSDATVKTVSALAANGAVFFAPDVNVENAPLEKLRKADGAINLSALMGRSKRLASIEEGAWKKLTDMWHEVSVTLYNEGLAPIHALITHALAVNGMGGPKINKKLRASNITDTSNKHAAMCTALKQLSEMLVRKAG